MQEKNNNKNATLIQSYYKSYYIQKKMNNIYKKLPIDIQKHVLYFIRQDYYIEKLNKKLNLIISNKINNYIIDFNDRLNNDYKIPFTLITHINSNEKNIIHIYKLFIKYKTILKNRSMLFNNLLYNLNQIHILLDNYENKIFNAYTNHICILTYILYSKLNYIFN